MKQCPRCKKEIASHAKVCPHCEYSLSVQPQQNRARKNIRTVYIVLALLFMLSPIIIGYALDEALLTKVFTGNSTITSYDSQIVLGELGDVENVIENITYQFADLDTFEKSIKGEAPQVSNIRTLEEELETIGKLQKSYTIYVTDLNNVYYYLMYTVTIDDTDFIELRLVFDMTKVTNEVEIKYYQQDRKEFSQIAYTSERYETLIQIVSLINQGDASALLEEVGTIFNEKETLFEERKAYIGHYGIGNHKSKEGSTFSMYVSGSSTQYTVRSTYLTKIGSKKFIL